jgi:hypothetical protein
MEGGEDSIESAPINARELRGKKTSAHHVDGSIQQGNDGQDAAKKMGGQARVKAGEKRAKLT